MTETVKVESFVEAVDPVTLLSAPTATTHIASSVARVKYPNLATVSEPELASQFVAVQAVEVHFPSGTVVEVDWIVTVLTSSADASLVGRRYRIRGAGQAGQTTALRVPVAEES